MDRVMIEDLAASGTRIQLGSTAYRVVRGPRGYGLLIGNQRKPRAWTSLEVVERVLNTARHLDDASRAWAPGPAWVYRDLPPGIHVEVHEGDGAGPASWNTRSRCSKR